MISSGGGGGTPLYQLYRYVPCAAPKGMVFEPFWSEMGIDFDHFGLKSGNWFSGEPQECINVFVFSTLNE